MFGAYDDKELLEHYAPGQLVTFTCDSDRERAPFDGILDCTEDGWEQRGYCLICE